MKRWLILIALLMSSVAWAGSTTVVVGQQVVTLAWTSDLCTGGTITSSANETGYEDDLAFDNNTTYASNFWYPGVLSDNTAPLSEPWIKYQLASGKTVEKVTITPGNNGSNGGNRCKTAIVAGSNNNSDWTDLCTCNLTNDAGTQTFYFDNDTSYTYYRVFVTDTYASYTGYALVGICEIEMMETTPTAGAYE